MANYRQKGLEKENPKYGWYTCVRCGRSFRKNDIDIDHIIPKNKGGSDSLYNLQCMCKHCNRSKKDTIDLQTGRDLARNAKDILLNEVNNFVEQLYDLKISVYLIYFM